MRVTVVHWFPLEQFPPAQNLLRFLAGQEQVSVSCLSTKNDRGYPDFFVDGCAMSRRAFPNSRMGKLRRLWLFLSFPIWVFLKLRRLKPEVVLYLEPHSAPGVFLYSVLHPRCRIFIHYHEYRELSHYRERGNLVARVARRLEQHWLYRRAEWISHTNSDRVDLFLQDVPGVAPEKMRVLPNYPPANWLGKHAAAWPGEGKPLRLFYAGAASFRDTWIREVCEWVLTQDAAEVTLDLMINNSDRETRDWLESIRCDQIGVNTIGIDYTQLPDLLSNFHVGLILYRGTTRNYVYNAPNKLFETLVCGLDVWYPSCMLGVKPYQRTDVVPRVLETDFEQLDRLDLPSRRSRAGLKEAPWTTTCEEPLGKLLQQMLTTDH
ncbi:MAG: hypothetical protein WCK86_23100 [Planctomycetia bacterium]